MTHNEEKNESIKTNPALAQILELAENNIRIVVTVFHKSKKLENQHTRDSEDKKNIQINSQMPIFFKDP